MSSPSARVPYLPGLDGLRALAVAAVIAYHADHSWLTGGFLGVEVFFVISGYLITLLLIGERQDTGRIRLGRFWMRRARRLLPALFLMLAALAIYLALFDRDVMGAYRGDFLGGLFYGSNWFQIWVGQGYASAEGLAPLRHLWSLAVEEQFYLVWPVVMALALRRSGPRLLRKAAWFVVIAVGLTAATAVLFVEGDIAAECSASMHGYVTVFDRCVNINEAMYLGTIPRISALLLGSAFAMVWRPDAIMRGRARGWARRIDLVALVGLGALGFLATRLFLGVAADDILFGLRYDPWLFRGGFLAVGVCTLMAIAAASHRKSWVGRLLGIRQLRWVGTRSYGLYLFHWPVFQVLREPGLPLTVTRFLVALAIVLPITEISYRVVEVPIRQGRLGAFLRGQRAKSRAAARGRRRIIVATSVLAVLAGYAAVSVAIADVQCEGQQCDFAAGNEAIDGVTPSFIGSTIVVTGSTGVVGTTAGDGSQVGFDTIPELATTSTFDPLDFVPTVAAGESVMLGAAPLLTEVGIVVDAQVSQTGPGLAEVLERMRAEGRLGRTVVIQIGTNGTVSDSTFARIMATVPAELTPRVVVMTVKAPRDWIAENNAKIRALPATYPQVTVVDWEAAANEVAGELSESDGGIHLETPIAKQFYTNLIFDAIGRPDLKG